MSPYRTQGEASSEPAPVKQRQPVAGWRRPNPFGCGAEYGLCGCYTGYLCEGCLSRISPENLALVKDWASRRVWVWQSELDAAWERSQRAAAVSR